MKLACQKLLMVDIQSTHFTMTSAGCAKNAEETVRNVCQWHDRRRPDHMPAAFIRLLFHVFALSWYAKQGRDASILLDPTAANGQPEKATTL
ncbi:hypothetical protein HU200_008031 [Digitaria exilis]|uniref:Uncharacterized protein n=1 Tax=Digitaria exilis TaxID=1010633 RepID=A0A835FNG3_9POAL|nr:hypothetical protein HU200_008031 [Digitaria exilis]